MIEVYTDGSCSGNGHSNSYGGGAYIIVINGQIFYKENFGTPNTTNQQMELEAAARACEYLERAYFLDDIVIYSDSAYLINCYNQNWWMNWSKNGWKNSKKEPVANRDLWERLIPFFKLKGFNFKKVKGHAGVELNELVDKMAVEGTTMSKKIGGVYESSNC